MIVTTEGVGRADVRALTAAMPGQIVLFGAEWCADCRRAHSWLTRHNVPFRHIDTDTEEERERAARIAGVSNIPVLVAPDGTVLVEPTDVELAATLAPYRRPRRFGGDAGCR